MLKKLIYIVLFFILSIQFLISAEVPLPLPDEPIMKQYDITGLVLPIKVVIHQSDETLNEAFKHFYDLKESSLLWGWYGIRDGVCEIHVTELKSVNKDPRMRTWGHELAHCVYGLYHK